MTNFLLFLFCTSLAGCACSHPAPVAVSTAQPTNASLYDRHISVYRGFYDNLLAAPKDAKTGRSYNRDLIDAVQGNFAAAHRLFHSSYRAQGGEFGETWDRHCWVMLLKLSDERFAGLLRTEDRHTRRLVGEAVTAYMQEDSPNTASPLRPSSTQPHRLNDALPRTIRACPPLNWAASEDSANGTCRRSAWLAGGHA